MNKKLTRLFMLIGAMLGGLVPLLWGAGYFSFSSVITSALGAIVGVWASYTLSRYIG